MSIRATRVSIGRVNAKSPTAIIKGAKINNNSNEHYNDESVHVNHNEDGNPSNRTDTMDMTKATTSILR